MNWQIGRQNILFPRPVLIMGVLNVTPDSFSDGGQFLNPEAAIERALQMVQDGAAIIDIGGESTRPQATPVPASEELRRVIPVIEGLSGQSEAIISIDTMKPQVAREAVTVGARVINDVAANRASDEMFRVVAETGAGYVLMHMQGEPQTMQQNPRYGDVVREVGAFFAESMLRAERTGVSPEQIVFDVGIGFGKTLEHNLTLIANLGWFGQFARPMLLGVSRKSFLGKLLGLEVDERLPGALACAAWAALQGAAIIRTHDVKETAAALRMIEALVQCKEA